MVEKIFLLLIDVDTWWWIRLAARGHADPAGKTDLWNNNNGT